MLAPSCAGTLGYILTRCTRSNMLYCIEACCPAPISGQGLAEAVRKCNPACTPCCSACGLCLAGADELSVCVNACLS